MTRFYELPSLAALVAFEATARSGSLKFAASELGVTPSAISHNIKALEKEAGGTLLIRGHRSIVLTAEGKALYEALSAGLGEIAEAFADIKVRLGGNKVAIGTTHAFGQLWLMPRLGRFWRDHEDINIDHVSSDNSEELRKPAVDLKIRYGTGVWPGEAAERMFGDRIYPVCGPGYSRRFKIRSVEDLKQTTLLSLERMDIGWTDWTDWLRSVGQTWRGAKVRTFNSYVIALQAAEDDQGVVMGWHRLVDPLVQAGRLVRVTKAEIEAPASYYLAWNEGRGLSPAALALKDWLMAEARSAH